MAELLWTAKWVFGGAIFLASIEILHCWWRINKRNRIPLHINEVFFVMSNQSGDNLRCFCNVYQTNMQQATACPNPHCKAKLLNKIVAHMNSAQHLICIAIYLIRLPPIVDAILAAQDRGVTIRVITDQSMTGCSDITRLNEKLIPVRIAGTGEQIMHNKFCLIDVLTDEKSIIENAHPQNGLLINGSMNWTLNGLCGNWENVLFTSDEHLKSEFKKAFDQIWSRLG